MLIWCSIYLIMGKVIAYIDIPLEGVAILSLCMILGHAITFSGYQIGVPFLALSSSVGKSLAHRPPGLYLYRSCDPSLTGTRGTTPLHQGMRKCCWEDNRLLHSVHPVLAW